jgi:nitrogen fixation NifU-like protein
MIYEELNQEIIRDHYKNPRNKKSLLELKAYENPSCGDSVKISVSETDGTVSVFFDGSGCSISMCSASMMTEVLTGKTVSEAKLIVDKFLSIMKKEESVEQLEELGDLFSLSGVVDLPVRAKCATLSWNAAQKILGELV